jgi:hypothetical protein
VIFIHRTTEAEIVDNTYLDEKPDLSLYEFVGPYSYPTAIGGTRTVYSFRKLPPDALKKAIEGLKRYNVDDEMAAHLNLWNRLSHLSKE